MLAELGCDVVNSMMIAASVSAARTPASSPQLSVLDLD
jgi:hypothetical protein